MKIIQIGKFFPPHYGGIESVTYELSHFLGANNIQNDILCFNKSNETIRETVNQSTVTRCSTLFTVFSMPLSISYFHQLFMARNEYDIFHVHLPNPIACLGLFFLPQPARIILHWHSDIIKQKELKLLYNPVVKYAIKRALAVIGATPAHLEGSDFSKEIGRKGVVIPYPFNSEAFKKVNIPEDVRFKHGIDLKEKKVILSIGRLTYYKGFSYLIKAARMLPKDYVILIAGSGELHKELSRLIKKSGLSERVVLVGKVSELQLHYLLSHCDLFCLPSIFKSEMFGMVQLEAMIYGKPVLSTDIPESGVPYVNIHGKTGLVVPPRDSRALATGILQILNDTVFCERIRNFSPKYVHEIFGVQSTASKYLDLCRKLMSNSPDAPLSV